MKCPKCGYVRQNRDNVFAPPTECPACGVVYAKYLTSDGAATFGPAATFGAMDAGAGLKKPSPVDAETLKKARDRVERRLRKKINPEEKDEYREQTLQRARLFVSEGVKKRRQEMQQRKVKEQEAARSEELPAQDLPADADPIPALAEPAVATEAALLEDPAMAFFEEPSEALPEEPALELSEEPTLELSEEPALELSEEPSVESTEAPTPELSGEPALEPSEEISEALTEAPALELAENPTTQQPDAPAVVLTAEDQDQAEAPSNREDKPGEQAASEAIAPPDDPVEGVPATESPVLTEAVPEEMAAGAHAAVDTGADDDRVFTIGAAETTEPVASQAPAAGEGKVAETPAVEPKLAALLAAASTTGRLTARRSGGGLMRLLPAVAWMILVAGVIGAILSWTSIGDVQAGIGAADLKGGGLPVALLLGFAYLATGVMGFAFFWVSSVINTQIKEIHLLLLQPLVSQQPEKE